MIEYVRYHMAFEIKKLGQLLNMGNDALHGANVVGIDIGASSIKVVSLTDGKTGAALETYGELQLGPIAGLDIGRTTNLEPGKLGNALVEILTEANVTARNGALAIPHTASFIAITEFPTTDQQQLASMVPIEARKLIPMAMNEVTLDWFVIPQKRMIANAENATPVLRGTQVLLAAIYNEALKRYRTVVQHAGLAVGMNEIESFSVIRSSIHENETTVMVLDLGAASTKMYIIQDGILHETHRMPVGGQDLTMAVAGSLNITPGEAEEVKRQIGFVAGGYDARIAEALTTPIERITHEARRVIERYETAGSEKVTKIVLAGGGAVLKGLRETLESALGVPVVLSNPFTKVEYPAFLEATLKEIGPSFAVAMGAALRRLAEK
jgi:type IV pilus assembly protein PilM